VAADTPDLTIVALLSAILLGWDAHRYGGDALSALITGEERTDRL